MLMIIYTDMPRMGKALRALKTWPEITAEHLEQCHDLGIVLLLLFFCFLFQFSFLSLYLSDPNEFSSACRANIVFTRQHCKCVVSREIFQVVLLFFSVFQRILHGPLSYSAILCPLGQTGGAAMQVVRDRRWPGLSTYSCPGDVESVDLLTMSLFKLF